MNTLPTPLVVSCYSDIGFMPPLAAMRLDWPVQLEREWRLPRGEVLHGPLPDCFGLRIRRQNEDAYAVTLVWGAEHRQWYSLRRRELLNTALAEVLQAMGTPLEYLLDQPLASAA